MDNIIRECRTPHHGPCDAVLSPATVHATLIQHGFDTRLATSDTIEAWEPATVIPLDGRGPVRDASAWVPVPHTTHALAVWLGY